MTQIDFNFSLPARSRDAIDQFFGVLGGSWSPSAADYSWPEYSDQPEFIFHKAQQAIDFCLQKPKASLAIYWHGDGMPKNAWICFTEDGALMAGVTCFEVEARAIYQVLSATYQGPFLCSVEDVPPRSMQEFEQRALRYSPIDLVLSELDKDH